MVRPVPGARVVYRPVAQSREQEQTEAFAAALFASEAEQTRVNDEYLRDHPEAARPIPRTPAVSGARPAPTPRLAAPPKPAAVSPPVSPPRPAPAEDAGATGAAAARSLIAVSPPRQSDDAAFEAGAASARALISPGDQTPYRQASPAAVSGAHGSTEHDAGAAEARRLLGL